jgi:hypothetical protein
MKKTISQFIILICLLVINHISAQVPQGIPYQAVIRDNAGAPLVNTPILVLFTLHQNTTDGAIEYQETQSATTNAFGVINTQFGTGTPTQGTFASIVWSNTSKFIQVEANDGNGFVDMGTQQMMSVPYAMYAFQSGSSGTTGPVGPQGEQGPAGNPGNGISTISIQNNELIITLDNGALVNAGQVITAGCTNSGACNYNPSANLSDGSCYFIGEICNDQNSNTVGDIINSNCECLGFDIVNGCTVQGACNYNPSANVSNNSCYFIGQNCDDANYGTMNDVYNNNCSCEGVVIVEGCADGNACNYNPQANVNVGCIYWNQSCDDGNYATYNDVITESCICQGLPGIIGCMDASACNYNAEATIGDYCNYPEFCKNCQGELFDIDTDGTCDNWDYCTDITACNFNDNYYSNDACSYDIDQDGRCDNEDECSDVNACNYNAQIYGYVNWCEYDNDQDGICNNQDFCSDINACNYTDPQAYYCIYPDQCSTCQGLNDIDQDGLCDFLDYCSDVSSCSYNNQIYGNASCYYDVDQDGACDLIDNCTDINACNYSDPLAYYCQYPDACVTCQGLIDVDQDGLCDYLDNCTDVTSCTYINEIYVNMSCYYDIDQDGLCDFIDGCTDLNACNFSNPDGSECYYTDIDNDGICDIYDPCVDSDNDGICDYQDYCTDPLATNYLGNGSIGGNSQIVSGAYLGAWSYIATGPTASSYMFINQMIYGFDPNTPFSCLYDADNDGINDEEDLCSDLSACNYNSPQNDWCYPDTDNDGICDNLDGCYSTQACNYNDPNATQCLLTDADGDQICDSFDNCFNVSACNYAQSGNPACIFPNTPCNDNNPNTSNDVIQGNCSCAGVVSHQPGDTYQGGIIVHIFQPGQSGYDVNAMHGIIIAEVDINTATWNNAGPLCDSWSYNGYSDWVLPNGEAWQYVVSNNLTYLFFGIYWSSTSFNTQLAMAWNAATNNLFADTKGNVRKVRAIRYF